MTGFEVMSTSPLLFWGMCGAAVMTVAISKSGFGGALGALSAPIMLFVLPPKLAIGVLLPLFLITDVWVVYIWRNFVNKRLLLIMCGFGLAGQFVGWALFDYFNDRTLTAIIGVVGLSTAITYGYGLIKRNKTSTQDKAAKMEKRIWSRAPLWCGLSGISSFVSLSGGVPAQVFLLPHALTKQVFVGTMSVYFFTINVAKVPLYLEKGLFTPIGLQTTLWLVPIIPFGVFAGKWLNARISTTLFYHITHAALLVMGIKLLFDAFS